MTAKHYEYTSLDDVIFEGRNRAYGAYLLRRLYNEHLGKGLTYAIAIFLLFLSIPLVMNKLWPKEFILPSTVPDKVVVFIEPPVFDAKEKLPDQPVSPPASQPRPTVTSGFPTKIVVNPVKPIQPATTIPPGIETGIDNPNGTGTSAVDQPGTGTGTAIGTMAPPTEIVPYAEVQPEFPGGPEALNRYLSDNIRFPELARRNGISGLVVVSFVVNYEGNITDFKILKNLGGGTDEEALRVIKAMPKWKPGKNNGHPVNVRFNLPVRFKLAQ